MKRIKKMFKCLLMLLFICIIGVVGMGYKEYQHALSREPLEEKISSIQAKDNYTPISELSQTYLDAVEAAEDHRFREHFGIDVIAVGRAVKNNLLSGSLREGGSTITQQLAKNLYFTQEKELIRKIAEAFMALRLERSYTKDEILELYVNTIYFGDGYYGIREASLGYYGKEPSRLTVEEAAMLAGLPNAPSAYSPTEHPELAEKRQRMVLQQMVKYGYLPQETAKKTVQSAGE